MVEARRRVELRIADRLHVSKLVTTLDALCRAYHGAMVVDPRPGMKVELQRQLAPLHARLDEATDRDERKDLKRQIREAKRNMRRLRRTAVF